MITLSEIRKNVNRVLLRYYALFRRADGRGARARPLLISRVPSNIFTASTHNYAELGVRSWSAGRGASAEICASLPTSVSTAPGLKVATNIQTLFAVKKFRFQKAGHHLAISQTFRAKKNQWPSNMN